MKIKELRAALAALPSDSDDSELEVWLPGSTIRLNLFGKGVFIRRNGKLMIEGNVNPGSALDEGAITRD